MSKSTCAHYGCDNPAVGFDKRQTATMPVPGWCGYCEEHEPSDPSAGAMRAAKEIQFRAHDIARHVSLETGGLTDEQLQFVARLIDREYEREENERVRELVEAVRQVKSERNLHGDRRVSAGAFARLDAALANIEAQGENVDND